MEIAKIIISAFGLIGIGGLLKSAFDYLYAEDKKRKDQSRHEFKEVKFKSMLILSQILIDYEKNKEKLSILRPDLKTRQELIEEIKLEWMNMALYASDSVIIFAKKFLEQPNQETFNEMVFAMRKSLYNIKSSLTSQDLKLNI
jgi:hypothetical protein